ncbi:MAG: hypothetical protein EAX96_06350 [Candidatus Lokiarchaeota archaeon]|nr:hypothetical protein [Candidatus Lokiarchaeota archaeon]
MFINSNLILLFPIDYLINHQNQLLTSGFNNLESSDYSADPADNYIFEGFSILISNVSNTEFSRLLIAPQYYDYLNHFYPIDESYDNVPTQIMKVGENWSYIGISEKETHKIFEQNWSSTKLTPVLNNLHNNSITFFKDYWKIENETYPGRNASLFADGLAQYSWNSSMGWIGYQDDGGNYNYSSPYEPQIFDIDYRAVYELGAGIEKIDFAQVFFEFINTMWSNQSQIVDNVSKLHYWYSIDHTGNLTNSVDFEDYHVADKGVLHDPNDFISDGDLFNETSIPDDLNPNFRRLTFTRSTANTLNNYDFKNHKFEDGEFNFTISTGTGAQFLENTEDYGWTFKIQSTSSLNVSYNTTFPLFNNRSIGTSFNVSNDIDLALTNFSVLITKLNQSRNLTAKIYTYDFESQSPSVLLDESVFNISSIGWQTLTLPNPIPMFENGSYCILFSSPNSNTSQDIELAFKNQWQDNQDIKNKTNNHFLISANNDLDVIETGDMVVELIFNSSSSPYYNRTNKDYYLDEELIKYNFSKDGTLLDNFESDFQIQNNTIQWEPSPYGNYPYLIQENYSNDPIFFISPYQYRSFSPNYPIGFFDSNQTSDPIDQYEERRIWTDGSILYTGKVFRDADDEDTGYVTFNPTTSLGEIYYHPRWSGIYGAENPRESQTNKLSFAADFNFGIGANFIYWFTETNLSTKMYTDAEIGFLNLSTRNDYLSYKYTGIDDWITNYFNTLTGSVQNNTYNVSDTISQLTGYELFTYDSSSHQYNYSLDTRNIKKSSAYGNNYIDWETLGYKYTDGNFSWTQKHHASSDYFSAFNNVTANVSQINQAYCIVPAPVIGVIGVWTTPKKNLTNYYPGGSFDESTGRINFGEPIPSGINNVYVEYYTNEYQGLGFMSNTSFTGYLNVTYENFFSLTDSNKLIGCSINVSNENLGLEAVNISIQGVQGTPPPLRMSLYELNESNGLGSNEGYPDLTKLIQTTTFQPNTSLSYPRWYLVNFSRESIVPLEKGHKYAIIIQSEGTPNAANYYSIRFSNAYHSNTPKSSYNFYIQDNDDLKLIKTGDLLSTIYLVKRVDPSEIDESDRYRQNQLIQLVQGVVDGSYSLPNNNHYIGTLLNLNINDYVYLRNFSFYISSYSGTPNLTFIITKNNASNLPDLSQTIHSKIITITHTGLNWINYTGSNMIKLWGGNYSFLIQGDSAGLSANIAYQSIDTEHDLIRNTGSGFFSIDGESITYIIRFLKPAYKKFSYKLDNNFVEWHLSYNYQGLSLYQQDVFWNETYSDWNLHEILAPNGSNLPLNNAVNKSTYCSLNKTTMESNGFGFYTLIMRSPLHAMDINKYRINNTGYEISNIDTLYLGSRYYFTSSILKININCSNDYGKNGIISISIKKPNNEIERGISRGPNVTFYYLFSSEGDYEITSFWYDCYSFAYNTSILTVKRPLLNFINPGNIHLNITGNYSILESESDRVVDITNGTFILKIFDWQYASLYKSFKANMDVNNLTNLDINLPKGAFSSILVTYLSGTEEEIILWGSNFTIGSFILIDLSDEVINWSTKAICDSKDYRRSQQLFVQITPINWEKPYYIRFGASSFSDWYFHTLSNQYIYVDYDFDIDQDFSNAQALENWAEYQISDYNISQNITFYFGIYHDDVNSSNDGDFSTPEDFNLFFDNLLGNIYVDVAYHEENYVTQDMEKSFDIEFVNLYVREKIAYIIPEYEYGTISVDFSVFSLGAYMSTTVAVNQNLTITLKNVTYHQKVNISCLYLPDTYLDEYTTVLFTSESKMYNITTDNSDKMFQISVDQEILNWQFAAAGVAKSQKITATIIPINQDQSWDLYIGSSLFMDDWGFFVSRDNIFVDDDDIHGQTGGTETGLPEKSIGNSEQVYWNTFSPSMQKHEVEFYIFVVYGSADYTSLTGQIYINPIGDVTSIFAPNGMNQTQITVKNYYSETATYYTRSFIDIGVASVPSSFPIPYFSSYNINLQLTNILSEASVNVTAVHIPYWAPYHVPEYDPNYLFKFPSPYVIVVPQITYNFRVVTNVTDDIFLIEQNQDTITWDYQPGTNSYYRSQQFTVEITPLNIITDWGIRVARIGDSTFQDSLGRSPSHIYFDDDGTHNQVIETGASEIEIFTSYTFIQKFSDFNKKTINFWIHATADADFSTLVGWIYFDVWINAPILINSTGDDYGAFNISIYNVFTDSRTVTLLADNPFGDLSISPSQFILGSYNNKSVEVQFGDFITDINMNLTQIFARTGVGNCYIIPTISKMIFINVNSSFYPVIMQPTILPDVHWASLDWFGTRVYFTNILHISFRLSNLYGDLPNNVTVYVNFGPFESVATYNQELNVYTADIPVYFTIFSDKITIRIDGYETITIYESSSITIVSLDYFILIIVIAASIIAILFIEIRRKIHSRSNRRRYFETRRED